MRERTWSLFQDAHMMVVGGIGLLISFMKRYRYSGIGFNFVIAAFCYQWAVLFQGLAFGDHKGSRVLTKLKDEKSVTHTVWVIKTKIEFVESFSRYSTGDCSIAWNTKRNDPLLDSISVCIYQSGRFGFIRLRNVFKLPGSDWLIPS